MLGCKFHFEKKKENRKKKCWVLRGKMLGRWRAFFLEFGNSMLTRQRENLGHWWYWWEYVEET